MQNPLVTIICISFNHADFLDDALNSIWNLAYHPIQLIVTDDASTDGSQQLIKKICKDQGVELILNETNIGHCKTFNNAIKLAKGEFVIDFSADDVLLPKSISQGVARFNEMGHAYDVLFADSEHINENGIRIGTHLTTSFFKDGKVPEGSIYKELLGKFFISPPTMVYRKSLIDKIGGYDEELYYEDFDFWVRSSRVSNYCYLPQITAQKRIHKDSVSSGQYISNSKMLDSTLKVCRTAYGINKNKSEDFALIKRIVYEVKMSIASNNLTVAYNLIILAIKVLFKTR